MKAYNTILNQIEAALSHGLGKNNKAGYSYTHGNSLEMTLTNLDKFEHVVTV